MDFTYCPFWVQVHGLPMGKMTRHSGQIIARHIGNLIGVEASSEGLLLARSFLQLRVEINTSLHRSQGFLLKRQTVNSPEKKGIWVDFKYDSNPNNPTSNTRPQLPLPTTIPFSKQCGPQNPHVKPTCAPLCIYIPESLHVGLSSVFIRLTLKRKAHEEPPTILNPSNTLKLDYKPSTDLLLAPAAPPKFNLGNITNLRRTRDRPAKKKGSAKPVIHQQSLCDIEV
ncbi:hypothetical protein ACSBR1_021150 [Camellia fascicularis]